MESLVTKMILTPNDLQLTQTQRVARKPIGLEVSMVRITHPQLTATHTLGVNADSEYGRDPAIVEY